MVFSLPEAVQDFWDGIRSCKNMFNKINQKIIVVVAAQDFWDGFEVAKTCSTK